MDSVVLIPAYKPGDDLVSFVGTLCKVPFDVVVVDDGGGEQFDGIFDQLEKVCRVIRYPVNKGKGGALKTGFRYIRENMPDCRYVITADADGQHKIPDIIKVADRLTEIEDGFVIGSRYFENEGNIPFKSKFGNKITRFVFKALTGVKIKDTQTGLRGFLASDLEWLEEIKGERYEYEMNMLMKAADQKVKIHEVDIATIYENDNSSSHFRPWRDSLRIYKTIYLGSTVLKYATSSVIAFIIDFTLMMIIKRLPEISGLDAAVNAAVATAGAWIVSSAVNFTINRTFVFEKKDELIKSLIGYYVLAVGVYLSKLAIIEALVWGGGKIGVSNSVLLELSKIIAEFVMFIVTYFVQHNFIFKNKKKKTSKN